MKYIKLFVFFISLSICSLAQAEIYRVDASVLNVRSCASTSCEIVGKLVSEDSVNVTQDMGEWVEIETTDGPGYVIKSALSADDDIATGFFYIIFFLLVIWGVLFIYLLPAKLATNNKNARRVFWVNLFLGWIPLIWLILLLAALVGESKDKEN